MRERFPLVYALLLMPLIVLLSYGNQFLYLSGAEFSDLTVSHLPNALFLRRSLLEWGQIPLWSPAILSGFPFAANPLSGLWYPPGWPAILWPEPWMFNLLAGLHLVWGGVGMVFLLRKEGVGQMAAIFGGLAFSFMPKLIAHFGAGHITLVYAVSWTPWLLFVSRITNYELRTGNCRIFEGVGGCTSPNTFKNSGSHPVNPGRPAIGYLPGVILAIIFYADVRWAAFAGMLWVGWWLLAPTMSNLQSFDKTQDKSPISILGQLILAAALSAPLGLPLAEFTQLSTRAALSTEDVLAFSLPPARLLGLLFPEFGGMQEWVVYPGAMVLVLASVGLAWPEVRRKTRFWWGVWWVALLFSLGENLPGMSLLAQLPGVSLLRVPSRAMFLAGMAMTVLAAYALDHVLVGVRSLDRRRAARVLVALVGVGLAVACGVWFLAGTLALNFAWGAGMIFVTALGVGFALGSRNPAWVGFLLIGIGLLDWGVVAARSLSPRPAEEIVSEQADVAEFLAAQGGNTISGEPFRVYSPSYSLPQHTAARFGLELADGVDPLQVASYAAFMAETSGVPQEGYSVTVPPFAGEVASANAEYVPDAAWLGWLNVRYVVVEFDVMVEGLVLARQFGETRVYENEGVLPRAWVQKARAGFPEGTIVANLLEWTPNRIKIQAEGQGMLVLSELAYPGWQVRVDGQAADLLVVEGVLRGVQLPLGNHQVVFDFRPASLFMGLALFGLAVVFLAVSTKLRQEKE